MNASFGGAETRTGYVMLHVGGHIEASTYPLDMRLQRMLDHLSALLIQNRGPCSSSASVLE